MTDDELEAERLAGQALRDVAARRISYREGKQIFEARSKREAMTIWAKIQIRRSFGIPVKDTIAALGGFGWFAWLIGEICYQVWKFTLTVRHRIRPKWTVDENGKRVERMK